MLGVFLRFWRAGARYCCLSMWEWQGFSRFWGAIRWCAGEPLLHYDARVPLRRRGRGLIVRPRR